MLTLIILSASTSTPSHTSTTREPSDQLEDESPVSRTREEEPSTLERRSRHPLDPLGIWGRVKTLLEQTEGKELKEGRGEEGEKDQLIIIHCWNVGG